VRWIEWDHSAVSMTTITLNERMFEFVSKGGAETMEMKAEDLEMYEPPMLAEVGEFIELTRGRCGPQPENSTFLPCH
jgi:hypothetical protein